MQGVSNILFVALGGLALLLVMIPLPKAMSSGNVGTAMLIIWTELACLVQFVNAIRWNRNIEDWSPVWCDFCGHFFIAADVGLVACAVAINRRLYMIVALDPMRDKKVLNAVVDIILCVVMPWVSIPLQYIVQQYRYAIYEDIGCIPGVGTVDLSFPLVWALPLFGGVVATGYASCTIRASHRRNHGMTGMSSTWCRRLVAIAAASTMYGLIPTTMSIILLATANPVKPWPGWRAIHSNIHEVAYVLGREWRSNSTRFASAELRRWTVVTLSYIIFLLLGLTTDVKKMYWAPFKTVMDSVSHTRTAPEHAVDGSLKVQKVPKLSRTSPFRRDYSLPFEKPRAGAGRRERVDLTDRPELDLDLESFQLVFPISQQNHDAISPMDPSWKPHLEEDECPDSYLTGSSDCFDRLARKV